MARRARTSRRPFGRRVEPRARSGSCSRPSSRAAAAELRLRAPRARATGAAGRRSPSPAEPGRAIAGRRPCRPVLAVPIRRRPGPARRAAARRPARGGRERRGCRRATTATSRSPWTPTSSWRRSPSTRRSPAIDRLRAAALVVPALEVTDRRPLLPARGHATGDRPHDDPDPARRVARRILQTLRRQAQVGRLPHRVHPRAARLRGQRAAAGDRGRGGARASRAC